MAKPAESSARQWAIFAPLVSARPDEMRIRIKSGKYRHRRGLPGERPAKPVAVYTYCAEGRTRCVSLDLDAKNGRSPADVLADCAALVELLTSCGGRCVVDESPSGGRHLYLPVTEPLAQAEVLPVLKAAKLRFRCLDINPMRNSRTGAIRPPGSAHPDGGAQVLVTPEAEAIAVFSHRSQPEVWERLRAALGVAHEPAAGRAADEEVALPSGPPRPLADRFLAIARDGDVEGRYPSPSEARAAVLVHAVWRRWAYADVAAEVESGRWPGLAELLESQPERRDGWEGVLDYEMASAERAVRRALARSDTPSQIGMIRDTRGSTPPPQDPIRGEGTAHAKESAEAGVGVWLSAVAAAARTPEEVWPGRGEVSVASILEVAEAVARMAVCTGTLSPDVGVRSISLATRSGLSRGVVARALRVLRSDPAPLLPRVQRWGGRRGDTLALRVPEGLAGPPSGPAPALPAVRWAESGERRARLETLYRAERERFHRRRSLAYFAELNRAGDLFARAMAAGPDESAVPVVPGTTAEATGGTDGVSVDRNTGEVLLAPDNQLLPAPEVSLPASRPTHGADGVGARPRQPRPAQRSAPTGPAARPVLEGVAVPGGEGNRLPPQDARLPSDARLVNEDPLDGLPTDHQPEAATREGSGRFDAVWQMWDRSMLGLTDLGEVTVPEPQVGKAGAEPGSRAPDEDSPDLATAARWDPDGHRFDNAAPANGALTCTDAAGAQPVVTGVSAEMLATAWLGAAEPADLDDLDDLDFEEAEEAAIRAAWGPTESEWGDLATWWESWGPGMTPARLPAMGCRAP